MDFSKHDYSFLHFSWSHTISDLRSPSFSHPTTTSQPSSLKQIKVKKANAPTSEELHVSKPSHVSNLKAALNNFKLSTWKSRQELARIYPSSFQTLGIEFITDFLF